jgi:hypothetical protein
MLACLTTIRAAAHRATISAQMAETERIHDVGFDGSDLPLNTLIVFNAALSFRFGWQE